MEVVEIVRHWFEKGSCHGNVGETEEGLKKIVLVGSPNVGKSVIFGNLTGKYVTVSNYPGTTVEVTLSQRFNRPTLEGFMQLMVAFSFFFLFYGVG